MDAAEQESFDRAVAGVLADNWGPPTSTPTASLEKLWPVAAAAGWLDLADVDALDALVRVVRGAGRVGCPLPLADVYVALRLLRHRNPELAARLRTADVRPLVVTGPGAPPTLDAVPTATHLLELPPAGPAWLTAIAGYRERPGVAVPPLAVAESGEPVYEFTVSDAERRRAVAVVRLALAARAIAAAAYTHELAIAHAGLRHQFGRPIGSFGAVQQRVAEAHVETSAASLLIEQAVRSAHDDEGSWLLAVELAVEHARTVASTVQFGAQHTLGALGFFDEHDAPWLFRRVHTDVAMIQALPAPSVADQMIDSERTLPTVDVDAEAAEFRDRLWAFLVGSELVRAKPQPFVDDPRTVGSLADAGYFGLTWPREHGGQGLRGAEQSVLVEVIGYGRVAAYVALNADMFLGNAILRYGTPAQREAFLPLIRRGQLRFCLGYSEPETGSDLGGLVTRATRDGEDWVINGQKAWTTRAHESDWIWLAARTHPDRGRRHAGITVFLVPLSTPGITIERHRSQAGEISCSVFFDDVPVADSARIGDVDGGWPVINTALAGERVAMGAITGALHALLDDLLSLLRRDPGLAGPAGSAKRAIVSALATRLQAARVLVRDAVDATTSGAGSRLEAPMAGVMGGETAEQFGRLVPEILGPEALTQDGTGDGVFCHNLLLSIKYVVGGGTNDVLRGLVARSLGLPR